MHIAHLETGRHVYGGARQVLLLAAGLVARGVTTTLICTAGGAVAAEARRQGLAVRELPMHGELDLAFIDRCARLLRETGAGLLHVHSRRGADWLGARAARRAALPAVLTRRVDRPESALIGGWKYRPYARVVAISAAIHAQLAAAGVPRSRLALIPSAVPLPAAPAWTRERLAQEFGLQPGQPLVGCIAQLIPRKGHALLLEAWPAILAACPGAQLLLFGQGPEEGRLRATIAARGFGGSVILAGFRHDLPQFLGRLDLVVHPASAEGLGLAVLEAQAAGVPVVACRAGGVPEILADGETGVLVPSGDAAALAAAVAGLLGAEPRRAALGAAARARVAREFGVADMVSRYLTLYGEVIETRNA